MPDLEEDVGIVAVDDLGPDDAGVRAVRLLDHEPGRVGIEHDVVVAEEQEDRALDRRRAPRWRPWRTRRAAGHRRTKAPGQGAGDPVGRILGGPVVEHEDRQRRVVLGPERRQALLEPRAGVVRDHDGDHGRDDLDRFGLVVALEQFGADRVGVDRVHEAGRG